MYTDDTEALTVDGKWGESIILFPFALKLAVNAYLGMLDRLVRQPGGEGEYQSADSSVFPIFGLTSSGSQWCVYVAYLPNCVKEGLGDDDPLCDEHSHMKLIWWGNVFHARDAGELLDIVDQIHEYAVTTHRAFVARHLETWAKYRAVQRLSQARNGMDTPDLSSSEDETDGWWAQIKKNSETVRKLLRNKRKDGEILTDDDLVRAKLEERLKPKTEEETTFGMTRAYCWGYFA
ncbi:hypothetical protein BJY04DRAFT_217207 [Aspergillus karnatakaensis]|uniref:uncharacterized protein n=1 Tax=Aspergillus karnatakaensis TaxID=1810916 RepID=UPI003CCD6A33